jgi:hypothetical protein
MKYVERLHSLGCALPILEVFTVVSGFVVDCETVEYEIFDAAGLQTNTSQPARDSIDVADCPTGDRLGTGRYAVRHLVPADEPLGAHTIKFYWKLLTADTVEHTTTVRFEVLLPGVIEDPIAPYYVSIAKMREEGVTAADASDARLLDRIGLASRMVEGWTKRHFEPRWLDLFVDGRGGKKILLDHPIIYVGEVAAGASPQDGDESLLDPESYRVYNRHISRGLMSPDDRNNPKVEFVAGRGDIFATAAFISSDTSAHGHDHLKFPRGAMNMRVSGVFGYTDPNGTLYGRTPRALEHATALLVMRELYKLTAVDKREDAQKRWRLLSETTRDQSYKLSPIAGSGGAHVAAAGYLSGDPAIDNILIQYLRPPAMGAA